MNTPAAEPLVPPSGGPPQQPSAPPAPPGYGQQPGCAAQSAYAAPSWPQQAVASQPGWGTPESRALQEAEAALRKARTALSWRSAPRWVPCSPSSPPSQCPG